MHTPQHRELWMPGEIPLRMEVHLSAQDTDGAFCLVVDHPPPGWGLPPHRHANESESVYVVEGRFEMEIDGTRYDMGPGDSCYVPAGVLHSGMAVGDEVAKRVIVFAPGGIEEFFLKVGGPAPATEFDAASLLAMAHEHGWDFTDAGS
jgi:quercetin dioxygenase-like cupin family protein